MDRPAVSFARLCSCRSDVVGALVDLSYVLPRVSQLLQAMDDNRRITRGRELPCEGLRAIVAVQILSCDLTLVWSGEAVAPLATR